MISEKRFLELLERLGLARRGGLPPLSFLAGQVRHELELHGEVIGDMVDLGIQFETGLKVGLLDSGSHLAPELALPPLNRLVRMERRPGQEKQSGVLDRQLLTGDICLG